MQAKSTISRFTWLLLVWMLFGSGSLFAQKGNKWLQLGQEAFALTDYVAAKEYYEWAEKKAPTWESAVGVGQCEEKLRRFRSAADWYGLALKREGCPPAIYERHGKMLLASGRAVRAAEEFEAYAEHLPDEDAGRYADLMNTIAALRGDSSDWNIHRLPFNTEAGEFSPVMIGYDLYFCSDRLTDPRIREVSTVDHSPLVDIYVARRDSQNGLWGPAKALDYMNSPWNEGPLAPFENGFILTRNDPEKSRRAFRSNTSALNELGLYSIGNNAEAGEASPLGTFNSEEYGVGHPTLSPDGRLLFFVSDMPGGLGGTDLYVAERTADGWGTPRNLGPGINSAGNELFPHWGMDGSFYFASDGLPGLGGLDIFWLPAELWQYPPRPRNLGYPLNSQADDFGIWVTDRDGNSGFYSTNRNASTEDDIYSFKRRQLKFDCQEQKENYYCHRFFEIGSMDPDTLPVAYEWNMGDGTTIRGLEVEHCFEGPGRYLVELNMVDTTSGFVFFNEATYEMVIEDHEQVFITGPETLMTGQVGEFDGAGTLLPDCLPERYYWEWGDGSSDRGLRSRHAYRKAGTYRVQLGVTGLAPGEAGTCMDCVYREVVVLDDMPAPDGDRPAPLRDEGSERPEPAVDPSMEDGRNDGQQPPGQAGPTKLLNYPDSLDLVFRLKVMESELPDDPQIAPLEEKHEVTVLPNGQGYMYTIGEEDLPARLFPLFRDARAMGFEDAVVIAWPAGPDSLSPHYVRLPARQFKDSIAIFSGMITDAEGRPIEARISLEDLREGVLITSIRNEPDGSFQLALASGKKIGYFVEAENFLPFSDHVDLSAGSPASPGLTSRQIVMVSLDSATGRPFKLNNVFFDFDSYQLRRESHSELDRLARILMENPKWKVEIRGHTDSEGPATYNLLLSRLRANSVVRYLILQGYPVSRVTAIGYGEGSPVASNATANGRQLNRRVEFFLSPI